MYPATIEALADYPARILLTTGDGFGTRGAGTPPPNFHIESWWPQADVLGAASAVIGHGGFGTTITALAAGLPQVILPLFAADQFLNAARVDEVGAGVHVEGGIGGVGVLPAALDAVLDEPAHRTTAGRIAGEIAALPPRSAAVPLVEALAAR